MQRLQIDELPDALHTYHPSQLKMWLSDSVVDHSVSKRLLTCAVAALRSNGSLNKSQNRNRIKTVLDCWTGSSGCHVYDVDVFSMEFYSRLGFVELKNLTPSQEVVYFGRIF